MKVKILCEFDVTSDEEDLDENAAKSAASLAAYDFLSLVEFGDRVTPAVTVHVDGFGECEVSIGEDHE